MATTSDLRKTYTDFAKTVTTSKPYYAVAGVGDLAVEKIRDLPERVSKLRSDLRDEESGVTAKVTKVPSKVADRAKEIPSDARRLTSKLGDLADEQVKAADERYTRLTARGEVIVKRIRNQKSTKDLLNQAQNTVTRARSVRGAAVRGGKNTKTAAKGTVTSARKTASQASKATTAAGSKVGD